MQPSLDWVTLVPVLLGVIVPAVSSFISREHWPSEITAGVTVVLSAVAGFVSQAVASGSFSFSQATLTALGTYVVAAIARSQFWKSTGADARLLAYPRRLPKRGELTSHFAGVPDDSGRHAAGSHPSPHPHN